MLELDLTSRGFESEYWISKILDGLRPWLGSLDWLPATPSLRLPLEKLERERNLLIPFPVTFGRSCRNDMMMQDPLVAALSRLQVRFL